ncbi:MAG TPA: DMT family transporter [Candidatus Cybelea sp.]|nr:DMT family transporter [Candidatus Cybelea sp.]
MSAWWTGLAPNTRGALLMVLSGLTYSFVAAMVKQLSQGYAMDGFEITFFRALIGFIGLFPFLAVAGSAGFRTRHLGKHVWRGILGSVSVFCAYIGIGKLALANYTALSFTKPLFAVILAALVIGEQVRWRRWAATVIGFLGVLVMIRPGSASFTVWSFLALGDAFAIALLITIVKRLPESETELVMMFYYGIVAIIVSAPFAILVWRWPSGIEWLLLTGVGLIGAVSQYLWILAFRAGEASAVAPFDYLRLLFAGMIGLILFGELPGAWTIGGAAVIVASTVYIARRESRLKRTGPAEAVKAEAIAAERPGL